MTADAVRVPYTTQVARPDDAALLDRLGVWLPDETDRDRRDASTYWPPN